jgi:predicted ATPase/DNA-binding winged helix-turn-helix (wHTH) protein
MSRPLDARSGQSFSFGPFLFTPDRQLLLENDKPIRIGSRALELLAVLLERPGELFTKDELISRVWPDTEVEESNLKVNVAALRKVFGEGRAGNRFIATTSGRGYRFVFPVRVLPAGMPAGSGRASGKNGHVVARVIGRADAADSLKGLLSRKRLVTIVGPGGIGKTTVARMMVEVSPVKMSDGVWLVDLAPTSEGRFVPNAVAASLGLFTTTDDVLAAVVAYLRDKQSLIILDNCEHLISDAANCAERIVHNAPNVGILATSREPLRVRGEQIFHLMPLECPPVGTAPEASEAKRFSAVELFEERASAVSDYKLTDTDTADVCDICRKLDGIPLAIELVASRADAFSVRELSTILFSQVQVLNRGRRGPKRHQDLNAMVDWSYRLLSANEQVLLRRLGVFAGQFSLEAACTIAADGGNTTPSLVEGIASLVTKSLVSTETTGERVRYRLLETTRLYACRKLEQSDEWSVTARRHLPSGLSR